MKDERWTMNKRLKKSFIHRPSFILHHFNGDAMITQLMIVHDGTRGETFCPECGRPQPAAAGPRLARAETAQAVCRDCGRRLAPGLVALLDLARAAQRVARIHRHTLVPPLHVLLDLARAAENYTHSVHERRRLAA
jgi:hypothetical protein